jgi:hypothetical protein
MVLILEKRVAMISVFPEEPCYAAAIVLLILQNAKETAEETMMGTEVMEETAVTAEMEEPSSVEGGRLAEETLQKLTYLIPFRPRR